MRLGKIDIAPNADRYYIIAEIGVNHGNDMALAKRQIELAHAGGAHAAKFQAYKAGKLASRHSPAYWDTTKETTLSQYELFQRYDAFEPEHYQELARHCEQVGIDFMCTAFDEDAVEFVDPLVRAHKIASADLTNVPLLRQIAGKGKPVLMSTGAATLGEICWAVDELRAHQASQIGVLHCVLNYPTPDQNAFLSRITRLRTLFPELPIGYSDHTLPHQRCFPVTAAYLLGARVIEKHFTHDKSLPGNDHYHAMDVDDLKGLVEDLERVRTLLGPTDEHAFLASQQPAIAHARRSIVVSRDVAAGEVLGPDHLTVKRPGTGIGAAEWDRVIGHVAREPLSEDTVLQWHHLTPSA
jgi:N-acetylneuraminate synthase